MTGLTASLLAIPIKMQTSHPVTSQLTSAGRVPGLCLLWQPQLHGTPQRGYHVEPSVHPVSPCPGRVRELGTYNLPIAHASKPEDLTCGSVPAAVTQEADAPTPCCGQDGLRTGAGPHSAPSHCTLSSPEALGRSAAGTAVLGRPGRSTVAREPCPCSSSPLPSSGTTPCWHEREFPILHTHGGVCTRTLSPSELLLPAVLSLVKF